VSADCFLDQVAEFNHGHGLSVAAHNSSQEREPAMTKVYRKRQGEEVRRTHSQLTAARNQFGDLDKPIVVDAIPDDPDGLLPEGKARDPIRVEITEFALEPDPPVPLEFKSYLTLQWRRENEGEFYAIHDVVEFSNRVPVQWPKELTIETRYFPVPEDKFILRYHLIPWSTNEETSEEAPIRIDKIAPYGDRPDPEDNPPAIRFTSTFITDETLTAEDGVECLIRDFADVDRDRIKVAVGWGLRPPDPGETIIPAFWGPLPDDGKVTIPRSHVEGLGSGTHFVTYTLIDPAGNISKLSIVNSISVALGTLPTNLKPHTVPLHDDGLINRADAYAKVKVDIPLYDNPQPEDQIVVEWGSVLVPPTIVGEDPPDLFSILVSWPRLKAEYDFVTGGEQNVKVGYRVERAPQVEFRPTPETIDIKVDFSMTGPIDPTDPDPNPVTPLLDKVKVIGNSGKENKLTDADFNAPATAKFKAPYPIVAGDIFTVYWNGVAVADTFTADGSERPGITEISITITWDEIVDGGMHPKLPVMYVMSNPSFPHNDQESFTTDVYVNVVPITPEAPVFPDLIPPFLNCVALRTVGGVIGYRVKVPPSSYLVPGEKIQMRWRVVDSDETTPIAVDKDEDLTIPDDAQTAGIDWFVEYDLHVLPTDAASTSRFTFADIDYTVPVDGSDKPSLKTHQIMSIALASPGATCELTGIPTP
jgi:hypothetical protein